MFNNKCSESSLVYIYVLMIYVTRRLITADFVFSNLCMLLQDFAACRIIEKKSCEKKFYSFDDSNGEIPSGLICRHDNVLPRIHGVKYPFYQCPSN